MTTVWFARARATEAAKAAGDFEMPIVTHKYFTRRALVAAIATGDAFISEVLS